MSQNFKNSLNLAIEWLLQTKNSLGGSSAYYSPVKGWSKPYPETTGYIIPTLLDYYHEENQPAVKKTAYEFAEWLLSIQNDKGFWHGGLYPTKERKPSVFNTGQILFGMICLFIETNDDKWAKSAEKGAKWLANNVGNDGSWQTGHYNNFNPAYYTRVAWPMLFAAKTLGNQFIREQAIMVLDSLIEKRNTNGTFLEWGFEKDKPAFTHTMAYTVRGFIEASRLLGDWERYGKKLEPTLEKFIR